jgi:hypothetical protein
MSSIVLSGDTSGTVTVSVPAVAGTNTATLPAATGTVMVSGNMPAFSAYANANQSVTTAVATKVVLNTEEFDTNNNFDSSTNYRFTPTVAGYYQINGAIGTFTSITQINASIYKNGSLYKSVVGYGASSSATVSAIVYFNGSTDYVELYVTMTGVTPAYYGNSGYTYFNGSMVRAA